MQTQKRWLTGPEIMILAIAREDIMDAASLYQDELADRVSSGAYKPRPNRGDDTTDDDDDDNEEVEEDARRRRLRRLSWAGLPRHGTLVNRTAEDVGVSIADDDTDQCLRGGKFDPTV